MLKYTGGGYGGSLPNIPAKDLSAEEVEQYGGMEFLVKTGLYVRHEIPDAEVKMKARGGIENKLSQPKTDNKSAED